MFSGVRLYDVTLGDALLSLCEYARASSSLTTLTLSGVLPTENLLKRSPAKALGDALAAGARGALPLTSLDLSDNELRDQGFVAVAQFLTNLRHGLTELNRSRPPCVLGVASPQFLNGSIQNLLGGTKTWLSHGPSDNLWARRL